MVPAAYCCAKVLQEWHVRKRAEVCAYLLFVMTGHFGLLGGLISVRVRLLQGDRLSHHRRRGVER